MAVTSRVMVYGFGSAFADGAASNDVDLLIVHPTLTRPPAVLLFNASIVCQSTSPACM
ncbi:hypothetical protein X735_22550 [Mesorhizobium sp. L2C085B000]|nr:hypothetical protein X735_22550 [Mesorhizobium sp. L2C085B000]